VSAFWVGQIVCRHGLRAGPAGLTRLSHSPPPLGVNLQFAPLTRVDKGTAGLSVAGSPVKVLQNGTLSSVTSGTLNSALEFAANVPAGQYQVCLDPPIGWASAVRTTHVLAGWICSATDARTGPQLVTFRLTPQLPQGGQ
jgi:hypothetical protein